MCSRIANSRYFMTDENRAVLEIEGEGAPFPYLQIWESRPEIYARQIAHFWNVVMPRVPTHAITVGPATILEKTQKAVILAAGEGKAGAVFNVVMNSPTTLVPATLLKFHADFTVIVDLAAAAGLPSPWNKAGQYFINPLKYS
jgi:hypothetical protein